MLRHVAMCIRTRRGRTQTQMGGFCWIPETLLHYDAASPTSAQTLQGIFLVLHAFCRS